MKFRNERVQVPCQGAAFAIKREFSEGREEYIGVLNGVAYRGAPTRQAAIDRMYRRIAFAMCR